MKRLLVLFLLSFTFASASVEMSVDVVYKPVDKNKYPYDDTEYYTVRYVVFCFNIKNCGSDTLRMPRFLNSYWCRWGGKRPDQFHFSLEDNVNSRGLPVKMTDAEMKVVELGPNETCIIEYSDTMEVKKDGTPPIVELTVSEQMGAKYKIWQGTLKAVAVLR